MNVTMKNGLAFFHISYIYSLLYYGRDEIIIDPTNAINVCAYEISIRETILG